MNKETLLKLDKLLEKVICHEPLTKDDRLFAHKLLKYTSEKTRNKSITLTPEQLELNSFIKNMIFESISDEEYNMLFESNKDVGYFQINNKNYTFKIKFVESKTSEVAE